MIYWQSGIISTEIFSNDASPVIPSGKLRKNEAGQTMVEYVMLMVLVAVAIFLTSPAISASIVDTFAGTSSMLELPEGSDPATPPSKPPPPRK